MGDNSEGCLNFSANVMISVKARSDLYLSSADFIDERAAMNGQENFDQDLFEQGYG